jgi:serine/threonine protein phosphatase PrpC
MGNFLDKPKTEKKSHEGSREGLSYQLSSMQGWRLEMEDAHTHDLSLRSPFEKWSFFAVFDGHAGSQVAEYVSNSLVDEILNQEYFKSLSSKQQEVQNNEYDVDKLIYSIQQGFLSLDATLKNKDMASGSTATALLITPKHYFFINAGDSRSLLIRKDTSILNNINQTNNSTNNSNQQENNNNDNNDNISNHNNKIHKTYTEAIQQGHFGEPHKSQLANNTQIGGILPNPYNENNDDNLESKPKEDGDSIKNVAQTTTDSSSASGDTKNSETNKSINQDHMGQFFCYYSTIDHKPYDEDEKRRIEKAGGMVLIQRINGALAVSRAFGDFDYKRNNELQPDEQQVSAKPVITVLDRTTDSDQIKDSYAVLACDGIYDVLSNENLTSYITYKMLCGEQMDQITKGCLDLCLDLGSRDNMSICIVKLDQAPKKNNVMAAREENLNKKITDLIEERVETDKKYDQIQNFTEPANKLFYDFYQQGDLKDICGEHHIYTTPVQDNRQGVPAQYHGGICEKHRIIRKFTEENLEKLCKSKVE